MNYRLFGKTGLSVSEIGIGGQSLGGGLYYRDDKEAIRMLEASFDAGINFFDTADHYGCGLSERLIGKVFGRRERRHRVVIATKVGTRYAPMAALTMRFRPLVRPLSRWLQSWKIHLHQIRSRFKEGDFSPAYLRRALDSSLTRLGTDYLDLVQLHKPPSSVLEDGGFCETMDRLVADGKIRHYGVACDHGPRMVDDALRCLALPGLSSVQVTVNLVQRQAIHRLLPQAQAQGVAVLVRNPGDQGYLSTAGSDIMAETYEKNRQEIRERMEHAQRFRFLVQERRTLTQAAIQYVLQLPGITVVLPRLFRRRELAEVLEAPFAPALTSQELQRIATTR